MRPFRARIALICLAFALVLIPVGIASNGTHVSGTISANTTWTLAGSPYVLDGNVTVAAGVTLTVDPGVVVKLNGQLRYLWVSGTLKAVGTQAQPIVFTSIQDDTVGGDSNGDGSATSPAPGQWYEIGINAGSASELRYVTVRYGGWGSANPAYGAISVNGAGTSVTIDHATITNNQRSGVKIYLGGATISASTISGNGNGVSANQGWMALKERSFVTGNSQDGLWFNLTGGYTGPASSVMDSDVAGNGRYGVTIGTQPALASLNFPHGNRNNIYGNATKQLDNYYARSDVDWSGNFWGESVYHWVNPSVCLGTGQNSRGRLAPRPTSQAPVAGPISSSVYGAGSPTVNCYYDKIKIGPDEFSPYYLGNAPVIPMSQLYGGLSATGNSKPLAVLRSDPVNAATGSFTHETTDLSLPGTGVAFAFTRSYNSLDPSAGSLGQGWQHNHATALTIRAIGDVSARMEDGQRFEYVRQSDGSFTPPAGTLSTLASVTGGYELVRSDQVTYRFDSSGKVTSVKDRNDKGLTYAYDGSGRLQTITDAAARQITLAYDGAGNLTSVATPDGRSVSYGYTSGRLTSVTDAAAKVWTYTYESRGLLEKEIDPLGRTVFRNVYGQDGRVLEQYDALNNKTTFAWDYLTQTQTITDARNKVWNGVPPLRWNSTTTNIYDRVGRLTAIDYSDATADVTFAYDASGNRTTMTDGAGTETRVYDDADRLSQVTRGTDTFAYVYDLAGNLTRRTYPDDTVTDYGFDDDSRMSTVASGGSTTSYSYDAAGNLTTTTLPSTNGHVETRTYDRAGRLTQIGSAKAGATLVDFAYTLDPVGNPTQVVRTGSLPGTTTYTYDNRHRLTEVCYATSCAGATDYIRWTYDAVGNRLTETRPSGTKTYSYNAADQLTLAGTTSYSYDSNGNQTAAGSRTFSYDLSDRLATTAANGTTTAYAYDGDGRRLESVVGSQVTKLLWDTSRSLPQLALERDGAGSLLRRYTYGRQRIAVSTAGSTSYFHYDNLGSVGNLTSSSGGTQWTYGYEPFGTTRTETHNDPAAAENMLKFAGEYLDASGLYHLRARQFDPAASRLLTRDPVEPPVSDPLVAAYVYAANRPTVLVDPSGKISVPGNDGQFAADDAATGVEVPEPWERRVESSFRFFTNYGLARHRSAGLVGNFWAETRQDPLNPPHHTERRWTGTWHRTVERK